MSTNDIQAQAAAYLAREDRGLTPAEQAERDAWLAQSTLHRVCYLRLQDAWEQADRLAALNEPMMRPVARASSGWGKPVFAALAATIILAVSGGYYTLTHAHKAQSYATEIGDTKSLRLADGTQVQLNSNTRLRTDLSRNTRTVTLDAGEAYFEVVHDPMRPFIVYAGSKRITDLGTKFSVYRDGDDVRVIVKEGRVQVDTMGNSSSVVADGGHVVMTRGTESLISGKPAKDIVNELSWRSGILMFDQKTLAEAAEEFNRYNARKLIVEGDARDMRIGGRFKANNMEAFILLLHRGFGLSVNNRGNNIIVSR